MAENPDLPQASPSEEAELHAILVSQGTLPGPETVDQQAEPDPEDAIADEMAQEMAGKEPVAAVDAQEPAEVAKPAETPAAQADEPSALAKGLQALAQRENKLHERERAIRDVERRAQDAEARLAQLQRLALEDPPAFYKALGQEKTAEIAEQLYTEELGDAAPPQLKAKKATYGLERRLKQLQQQVQQNEMLVRQRQIEANAISYLHGVAQKVPETLPYLKNEADADPASVAQALYARIQVLAQGGQLPQGANDDEIAAMAAQSLDTEIKNTVDRLKRIHLREQAAAKTGQAPVKTPDPVAGEKKSAKTLSNKNSQVLTRPHKAALTREEELELIVQKIKSGDFTPIP